MHKIDLEEIRYQKGIEILEEICVLANKAKELGLENFHLELEQAWENIMDFYRPSVS